MNENQQVPRKVPEPTASVVSDAVEEFHRKGGTIKKLPSKVRKSKPTKKPAAKNPGESSGRKPVLTAWRMLGIRKGTKLTCKVDGKVVSEKYSARTISEAGMNLEVTIKGRNKPAETDGLMRAEMLVRAILKKTVKKPQGWDFWGIDKNGKWISIHSLFENTDRATLLKRRNY